MALKGQFISNSELTREQEVNNRANNGTNNNQITIQKVSFKVKKSKKRKKKKSMSLKKALSYKGNTYKKMTYKQLQNATTVMAREARKRLKVTKEGAAFKTMQQIANPKSVRRNVKGISLDKESNIKISLKFTGKNKLTYNQLQSLRKTLYDYLRDETSTPEGLERRRQKQAKIIDLREDELLNKDNITYRDALDNAESSSDLIRFAQKRLEWDSSDIFAAIDQIDGKYKAMHSHNYFVRQKFFRQLKQDIINKIGDELDMPIKDMNNFDY